MSQTERVKEPLKDRIVIDEVVYDLRRKPGCRSIFYLIWDGPHTFQYLHTHYCPDAMNVPLVRILNWTQGQVDAAVQEMVSDKNLPWKIVYQAAE